MSVLLQTNCTRLSVKAFTITQHCEIIYWVGFKLLLEYKLCAKRISENLQLELTSTRHSQEESFHDY
jgi:hypothetical protein